MQVAQAQWQVHVAKSLTSQILERRGRPDGTGPIRVGDSGLAALKLDLANEEALISKARRVVVAEGRVAAAKVSAPTDPRLRSRGPPTPAPGITAAAHQAHDAQHIVGQAPGQQSVPSIQAATVRKPVPGGQGVSSGQDMPAGGGCRPSFGMTATEAAAPSETSAYADAGSGTVSQWQQQQHVEIAGLQQRGLQQLSMQVDAAAGHAAALPAKRLDFGPPVATGKGSLETSMWLAAMELDAPSVQLGCLPPAADSVPPSDLQLPVGPIAAATASGGAAAAAAAAADVSTAAAGGGSAAGIQVSFEDSFEPVGMDYSPGRPPLSSQLLEVSTEQEASTPSCRESPGESFEWAQPAAASPALQQAQPHGFPGTPMTAAPAACAPALCTPPGQQQQQQQQRAGSSSPSSPGLWSLPSTAAMEACTLPSEPVSISAQPVSGLKVAAVASRVAARPAAEGQLSWSGTLCFPGMKAVEVEGRWQHLPLTGTQPVGAALVAAAAVLPTGWR